MGRTALCGWVMGVEPKQRVRLVQWSVAMLLGACSVLNMFYLVWLGIAPLVPAAVWSLVLLGGFFAVFLVIRSGRNLGFAEPSLTVPQMVFATLCGAAGYAIAGEARGGALPIMMVIFMFGMYGLTPRQIWRVGWFAVAVLGITMAVMSRLQPEVFVPAVESSHFFMIAVMVPAVAMMTSQLSRMRERLRRQKKDISAALARIQDLATRDELTGLINRRHMVELMEQERQRGVRSGQTFSIALLRLDEHARLSVARGASYGDELLKCFAREALAVIRISDLLSRWNGAQFLLMLSDTRSSLARQSLERLRDRIRSLSTDPAEPEAHAGFSVGVTEHRAGESISQTIERAELALQNAQAAGIDRVVLT